MAYCSQIFLTLKIPKVENIVTLDNQEILSPNSCLKIKF